MIQLQDKLITNDWVPAEWNTHINEIESPDREVTQRQIRQWLMTEFQK